MKRKTFAIFSGILVGIAISIAFVDRGVNHAERFSEKTPARVMNSPGESHTVSRNVPRPRKIPISHPPKISPISDEYRQFAQKVEASRSEFWNKLGEFANDVEMTDDQWERFVQDLIEVSEYDRVFMDTPGRRTREEASALTRAIDDELKKRMHYLTPRQWGEFNFRFIPAGVTFSIMNINRLESVEST